MKDKRFIVNDYFFYDYDHKSFFLDEGDSKKSFELKGIPGLLFEFFISKFDQELGESPFISTDDLEDAGFSRPDNSIVSINKIFKKACQEDNCIIDSHYGASEYKCKTGRLTERQSSENNDRPLICLHRGGPFWKSKDVHLEISIDEDLFLSLPDLQLKSLSNDQKQQIKLASSVFTFSKQDVGLENLCEENRLDEVLFLRLLEKNRLAIALEFAKDIRGNHKNEQIVGVLTSSMYGRDNTVRYTLYKTDYFTHKVIETTLYQLYEKTPIPFVINPGNLSAKKAWRTSLGVSIVVEIPFSNDTSAIILTRRSNLASYENKSGVEPLYVSATETVQFLDVLDNANDPLLSIIQRALKEELGIDPSLIESIRISSGFYSDYLQDNIAATVVLQKIAPITSVDELWQKTLSTRPPALDEEVSEYYLNTIDEVRELLNEKTLQEKLDSGELRKQTVFSLKEHLDHR